MQQYGARGSNAWEAGEGRLVSNQEVRTRGTETGSRFFECRPYRPSNSGESAIPESRATRATTSPIARNERPCVDDGTRVADCANRQAKRVAKCGVMGRSINASELKRRQNQEPVGGEAKDPRDRRGKDRCVVLLGRSYQGRPEAGDTVTMISHCVEISIAGGGADEKDVHMPTTAVLLYKYHSGSKGICYYTRIARTIST